VIPENALLGTALLDRAGPDIASATPARQTRLLLTDTTNSLEAVGTEVPP
jgi:hypothetical protein